MIHGKSKMLIAFANGPLFFIFFFSEKYLWGVIFVIYREHCRLKINGLKRLFKFVLVVKQLTYLLGFYLFIKWVLQSKCFQNKQ